MNLKRIRLSPFLLMVSCFLLVALKLWLLSPHELVALKMPHDDTLFISLAESIVQGDWLGQFTQLTMIKGPFYPLFISIAYLLNIPLLTAQQLLYAFACAVCIRALFPVVSNNWLLLIGFMLLLFNPFSYNYPAVGRVFRLGIYQSLGLLVFASYVGLYIRAHISFRATFFWAFLTGIALSAFWHTREESIWIVPSLGILLVASLICYKNYKSPRPALFLLVLIIPLAILSVFTITLKSINYAYYDIFATIELETDEFKSAYGGLLRIKSDEWRRYHPVVREVRQQAYEVSPTFRKLKPFLEGDVGQNWVEMSGTGDISAAFFIWAFRDAVAYAGYYDNGASAMKFYDQMGQEIDEACEAKKLDCNPRITSLVPTWHWEFNQLILPTYFSVFKKIISFEGSSADHREHMSKGSSDLMNRYATITRENLRTSKKDILNYYPEYHNQLGREKIRILEDITAFYRAFVPVLFVSSFLFLTALFIIPSLRNRLSSYSIIAVASLAGICSIALILTMVVITSYVSIHRAMHVSYPVVLLFIVFTGLAVSELFSSSTKDHLS